jgi:hypothetical protein
MRAVLELPVARQLPHDPGIRLGIDAIESAPPS